MKTVKTDINYKCKIAITIDKYKYEHSLFKMSSLWKRIAIKRDLLRKSQHTDSSFINYEILGEKFTKQIEITFLNSKLAFCNNRDGVLYIRSVVIELSRPRTGVRQC